MSKKIIASAAVILALLIAGIAFFIHSKNSNTSAGNSSSTQTTTNAAPIDYAAKVIVANGTLTAKNTSASTRQLARNSLVFEHDTLSTGDNSQAEIHFTDGTLLGIQPNSLVTIDTYLFNGTQAQTNAPNGIKFALKLVKGGLTSVTGQIAHIDPSSYQLSAGVATIGVHGTQYDVQITNDGLVVAKVIQGQITIKSKSTTKPVVLDATKPDSTFAVVKKTGITPYKVLPVAIAKTFRPTIHFVSPLPTFTHPMVTHPVVSHPIVTAVTKPNKPVTAIKTTTPKNLVKTANAPKAGVKPNTVNKANAGNKTNTNNKNANKNKANTPANKTNAKTKATKQNNNKDNAGNNSNQSTATKGKGAKNTAGTSSNNKKNNNSKNNNKNNNTKNTSKAATKTTATKTATKSVATQTTKSTTKTKPAAANTHPVKKAASHKAQASLDTTTED